MTSVVPRDDPGLARAVGDVCLHFYDADGRTIEFAGSDRLVRPPLEVLRAVPDLVALVAGASKASAIIGGAQAGLIRTLITDALTAEAVLRTLQKG
jgi:DNA-binding transcriptional regulator LsrR (DeoR family)